MTTKKPKPKRQRATRPFPSDGLVDISEALEFLNVGRTHFYSLIKKGTVKPPVKLGGARRWPAEHIRAVAGAAA